MNIQFDLVNSSTFKSVSFPGSWGLNIRGLNRELTRTRAKVHSIKNVTHGSLARGGNTKEHIVFVMKTPAIISFDFIRSFLITRQNKFEWVVVYKPRTPCKCIHLYINSDDFAKFTKIFLQAVCKEQNKTSSSRTQLVWSSNSFKTLELYTFKKQLKATNYACLPFVVS